MRSKTATIRELRTDFRSVKRRIEEYGEVVITDRGAAAYVIKPLPSTRKMPSAMPDYYARLVKRQPKPLSLEQTQKFWEEERR